MDTTVIRQLEGGEVTLRVPEQYFEDAWDRAGGFRDTAQLVAVEIGTFEPITRREEGERNRQRIRNWMHFVVAANAPLPEVAAIAAAGGRGHRRCAIPGSQPTSHELRGAFR